MCGGASNNEVNDDTDTEEGEHERYNKFNGVNATCGEMNLKNYFVVRVVNENWTGFVKTSTVHHE